MEDSSRSCRINRKMEESSRPCLINREMEESSRPCLINRWILEYAAYELFNQFSNGGSVHWTWVKEYLKDVPILVHQSDNLEAYYHHLIEFMYQLLSLKLMTERNLTSRSDSTIELPKLLEDIASILDRLLSFSFNPEILDKSDTDAVNDLVCTIKMQAAYELHSIGELTQAQYNDEWNRHQIVPSRNYSKIMSDCRHFLSNCFNKVSFLSKISNQILMSKHIVIGLQQSSLNSGVQTLPEQADHLPTRNDGVVSVQANSEINEIQDIHVSSQNSNNDDLDVEMDNSTNSDVSFEIPIMGRLKTVKSNNGSTNAQVENVTIRETKNNQQKDINSYKNGNKELCSFFRDPNACELGESSWGNVALDISKGKPAKKKSSCVENPKDGLPSKRLAEIEDESAKKRNSSVENPEDGPSPKRLAELPILTDSRGNIEKKEKSGKKKCSESYPKDCIPSTSGHVPLASTDSRGKEKLAQDTTKKKDSLIEQPRNDRLQKGNCVSVTSDSTDDNSSGESASESFERFSELSRNSKKKKRTVWTSKEEEEVYRGVQKHGLKWATIATRLPGRTNVNIKDKWRNMRRQGRIEELANIFGKIAEQFL